MASKRLKKQPILGPKMTKLSRLYAFVPPVCQDFFTLIEIEVA